MYNTEDSYKYTYTHRYTSTLHHMHSSMGTG
jgi:hypothetical protein